MFALLRGGGIFCSANPMRFGLSGGHAKKKEKKQKLTQRRRAHPIFFLRGGALPIAYSDVISTTATNQRTNEKTNERTNEQQENNKMTIITPVKMTVAQLREELKARGLDNAGLKPALVTRLQEAMDVEAGGGGGGGGGGGQAAGASCTRKHGKRACTASYSRTRANTQGQSSHLDEERNHFLPPAPHTAVVII